MHGSPNAAFAAVILLLLAAILVSVASAIVAGAFIFLDRPVIRRTYKAALIALVAVNAALILVDARVWFALVVGRAARGRIIDDFPIIGAARYVGILMLFAVAAPLVRRLFKRYGAGGIRQ